MNEVIAYDLTTAWCTRAVSLLLACVDWGAGSGVSGVCLAGVTQRAAM
jgi:hypothetical protein